MPAEATCPHCQLKLRVPADYAGRSVKCPQCQQRFIVNSTGNEPAAVPATAVLSRAITPRSSGAFEELIMSVLDEDEVEVEGDAHIEKVAGPSHSWRCPKCAALWEKKVLSAASLQNTRIKPMVRCETCGTAVAYADMQGGKFDAPEIRLTCPHCRLHVNGPAEDLLGQPCPGCAHHLPRQ